MNNIFFSQDPSLQLSQDFMEYVKLAERSYDQDKIIEWIDSHEALLKDKKVWLLTGHAYVQTYEEWEAWLLDNEYDVVIDCRGWGQALLGNSKFRYSHLKEALEPKGVAVYSLSND